MKLNGKLFKAGDAVLVEGREGLWLIHAVGFGIATLDAVHADKAQPALAEKTEPAGPNGTRAAVSMRRCAALESLRHASV